MSKFELSKLIAKRLGLNVFSVACTLAELGYEVKELNDHEINQWTNKVEDSIYNY